MITRIFVCCGALVCFVSVSSAGAGTLKDHNADDLPLTGAAGDAPITTEEESVIAAAITVQAISPILQGELLTVHCDVKNDGDETRSFGVGAEIKDGAVTIADLGQQTASSVSPGSTGTVTFTYTIPESWHAKDYTLYAVAWSGTPGSSTWLDSDERDFTVNPTLFSLNGRIAYHSYSDYMAAPVDSTDGHVFVYRADSDSLTKATDGLPVGNAMNPHFSPDGAKIAFMAIPAGAARNRNSLEVYVLDLASASLARLTTDSVPDEDPKFSPDGNFLVWKRQGQIWRMSSDGSSPTQLTTTRDEKSGPNYSPDGSRIVYWSEAGSSADVWWMSGSGSDPAEIVGNADVQDYYPIYRDAGNILYTRWESTEDHHDKIYNYNISATSSTRLAVNITGVEDADAAPVDGTYLVFSSTRSGGDGSYDVYAARYDNGGAHTLSAANSEHKDLGPCYSEYSYARSAILLSPGDGSDLEAEQSVLLTAQLWSDGAAWSGANPSVTFSGPTTVEYTGLTDDGTRGDVIAGDGIYSKTVTLPAATGSYSVSADAESVEPGVSRQVESGEAAVTLHPAGSARILQALQPTPDGRSMVIFWSSLADGTYSLYVSSNLLDGFSILASNLAATPPENTYTDSIHNCDQKFWKVTVE